MLAANTSKPPLIGTDVIDEAVEITVDRGRELNHNHFSICLALCLIVDLFTRTTLGMLFALDPTG